MHQLNQQKKYNNKKKDDSNLLKNPIHSSAESLSDDSYRIQIDRLLEHSKSLYEQLKQPVVSFEQMKKFLVESKGNKNFLRIIVEEFKVNESEFFLLLNQVKDMISDSTLKSRITRIRTKLKQHIEYEMEESTNLQDIE